MILSIFASARWSSVSKSACLLIPRLRDFEANHCFNGGMFGGMVCFDILGRVDKPSLLRIWNLMVSKRISKISWKSIELEKLKMLAKAASISIYFSMISLFRWREVWLCLIALIQCATTEALTHECVRSCKPQHIISAELKFRATHWHWHKEFCKHEI